MLTADTGRQHLGSYINLVAYYIVAMPISIFCGFFLEWELLGLWTGVAVALLVIAVIEVFIILGTDWDKVVEDAKNRVEAS